MANFNTPTHLASSLISPLLVIPHPCPLIEMLLWTSLWVMGHFPWSSRSTSKPFIWCESKAKVTDSELTSVMQLEISNWQGTNLIHNSLSHTVKHSTESEQVYAHLCIEHHSLPATLYLLYRIDCTRGIIARWLQNYSWVSPHTQECLLRQNLCNIFTIENWNHHKLNYI